MKTYKKYKIGVQIPYNAQKEGIIQRIESYQYSVLRSITYYSLCLMTVGLLYLLSKWYISIYIFIRFQESDVWNADQFLIHGLDKSITLTPSFNKYFAIQKEQKLQKIFDYRFQRYYFDEKQNSFIPIEFNLSTIQNNQFLTQYHKGILSQNQLNNLRCKFRLNCASPPDKSMVSVLVEEVLSPFYIFSAFSIILWYIVNYYIYATFILILSLLSIGGQLHQFFVNFRKLQAAAKNDSIVKVYRFCDGLTSLINGRVEVNEEMLLTNKYTEHKSDQLVPGDLVQIEDNQVMPCDLILLTGQSLMNEAMLTGESVPIMKNILPYNQFAFNQQGEGKLSTLFAGTICLETKIANKGKSPVLAVVTQTGFKTLKGQLILSIMFKSSNTFKFYQDALKYIAVLAMIAVVGCLITIKSKLDQIQEFGISYTSIIIQLFSLVSTAVPPAMPLFLQIATSIGLYRLKKNQIFCISSSKITTAGNITVMCFDKTGTLTEDCMDIHRVMTIGQNIGNNELVFNNQTESYQEYQVQQHFQFQNINDEIMLSAFRNGLVTNYSCSASVLIKYTMASCHNLTMLQGKIIGDPLDLKVFEATFSEILSPNNDDVELKQIILVPNSTNLDQIEFGSSDQIKLEIIRKFDFQSKLQRMSVVVKTPGGIVVFCKGCPENIRELCISKSIPSTYQQVLENHTKKGLRVIACAARVVNITKQLILHGERKMFECDLTFIGFIILQNKLKIISKQVIQDLQKADIRTIMVTGDNIFTAISVARSCGIIQKNQQVYFGDLEQFKKNQRPKITWRDFDTFDKKPTRQEIIPRQEIMNQDMKQNVQGQPFNKQKSLKNIFKNQQFTMKKISLQKETQPLTRSTKINIDDQEPWMNSSNDYVLALSGAVLNFLIEKDEFNPDIKYQNILERAQVYARVSPEDKGVLVKQLKTRLLSKPLVGFCGDGANDCVALNTADVGISINQAEASIAAPFTSQIQDISCVPILLCEGRAALTTSLICFKYIIIYSMIEFTTSCILYLYKTDMTNNEYLFIDMFTVLPISMTMGLTLARTTLTKSIPRSSMMSFEVICSVVGQGVIQVIFQIVVFVKLLQQDWFIPAQNLYPPNYDELDEAMHISYESTTLFLFSNLQYVFTIIAFSSGTPFRQPFYTNLYFTVCCIFKLILDYSLMIFYQSDDYPIYGYLGLRFSTDSTKMSKDWIIFLALITLLNGLVSLIFERLFVKFLAKIFSKKNTILVK